MTLEILYECDVSNIRIEGNDYVFDNVRNAENFYSKISPHQAMSFKFCHADSLHLEHIPSDSFDLVYTGYLDPIVDSLGLYTADGSNIKSRIDKFKSYCDDSTDKAEEVLTRLDQNAQEKYHSDFVKQMIRIAKPCAPIIIEFVSFPVCGSLGQSNWGGVDIEFWIDGPQKYGWDVDPNPNSIVIFEVSLNGKKRYNVKLMKNPSTSVHIK
eukprot:scaffold35278_cov54-Attheya_sp.AAC.5